MNRSKEPIGNVHYDIRFEQGRAGSVRSYSTHVLMAKQYVEQHGQGYRIVGSRVSLDSVIVAFLEGLSPETIAAECFPTLTLEQVYGAITYY